MGQEPHWNRRVSGGRFGEFVYWGQHVRFVELGRTGKQVDMATAVPRLHWARGGGVPQLVVSLLSETNLLQLLDADGVDHYLAGGALLPCY